MGKAGRSGGMVGATVLGLALLASGCLVRTVGSRPASPPVHSPPPPPPPVVIYAPPAGPPPPPPVYGRPVRAAPAPAHIPPGQSRSAEVHRRNAERKADHDAAKAHKHDGHKGKSKRKGPKQDWKPVEP